MVYPRKHEGTLWGDGNVLYLDLGCSYKRYKHKGKNHYKPCPEDFTIINYASIKTKEEKQKSNRWNTPVVHYLYEAQGLHFI